MTTATITRTKEYLVIKIPLQKMEERSFAISSKEEAIIRDGLRAMDAGRVSKRFKTAREAISFLKKI